MRSLDDRKVVQAFSFTYQDWTESLRRAIMLVCTDTPLSQRTCSMSVSSVLGPMPGTGGYGLRVGTPDPNKYHEASSVVLEHSGQSITSKMPGGCGYPGLRGVVIPRATRNGASRGYNHLEPKKVFVHLGPDRGAVAVDMATLGTHASAVAAALTDNLNNFADEDDAAVATFVNFSENGGSMIPEETTLQAAPLEQSPQVEERQAPLHMPGTYVVPRATSGGGQKVAAAAPPVQTVSAPPPVAQVSIPEEAVVIPPAGPAVASPVAPPATGPSNLQNGSLHSALAEPPQSAVQQVRETQQRVRRDGRKVTFEFPRTGQFTPTYHAVIQEGSTLVLVYDHSDPVHTLYVPPELEDDHGNPEGIACMLHPAEGQQARLFLVYYAGCRFRYGNEEFIILIIEKERPLEQ